METKIIKINHFGEIKVLKKPYDLYEMYTDFLISEEELDEPNEDILGVINDIRDYYQKIWENVPVGTYDIDKFEKIALDII